MNCAEITKAIEIHRLLDNLECSGTLNDYYRINHTTPEQRSRIAEKLAQAIIPELQAIGVQIDI